MPLPTCRPTQQQLHINLSFEEAQLCMQMALVPRFRHSNSDAADMQDKTYFSFADRGQDGHVAVGSVAERSGSQASSQMRCRAHLATRVKGHFALV